MNSSRFGVPVENRYFEDYFLNFVHEFGEIPIEEEEIISFGRQFDPQVFHTDPEAAKSTMYEGLIASGWHTASLMMREFVGHYLSKVASLGSPGVDELRWNMPVKPGDRLTLRVTITQADRSRSKPDRGMVHCFLSGRMILARLLNLGGLKIPPHVCKSAPDFKKVLDNNDDER